MKKYNLTLLLVFVAVLPMLLLRDFTPDNELRYLSIADEALRTGHFFSFTNHGVPYCDKPPLYLWIVMLGRYWFGAHCMTFVGLFSLVPALLTVGVMQRWCRRELNEEIREAAPWMLLTTAYFIGTAVVLRMDMLMCLFITLSLRTFYNWYTGAGNARTCRWLFPLFIFLGIFTKAFMGFLIPFVSILVFLLWKHEGRIFFRYWGWRTWLVIFVGLGAWFAAVYVEGGRNYLHSLVVDQTVNRSVRVSEHKQPFYYYAIALTYAIAPWTLFYLGTLVVNLFKRRISSDMQCLFWVVIFSTFLMLSCFGSKLQVYLVPIFPFLTYLSLMQARRFKWNGWLAFAAAFPAIVLFFALPAYIYALMQPAFAYGSVWIGIAAGLLTVCAVSSLFYIFRKKMIYRGIRQMSMGIFAALFVGSFALPRLNAEIGYGQIARQAEAEAHDCGITQFCTYKMRRAENLDVYFGQPVTILNENELSDTLAARCVLITREKFLSDTLLMHAMSGQTMKKCGKYVLFVPKKR